MNVEDFEGKVSIITGGALGIGRGAAIGFAQAGANVVIADVNVDAGQETEARAKAFSHGARFVEADVARTADCQRVVSETTSAFGRVDVLVNNVGIQPVESYKNVEETPEAIWDRIHDVNLKSAFLMSKYAIPEMRKQGGGAIINTASVQGLQSQPLVPAYAASKGGILSLTRQMALDYAPENIRVLAVCPGAIDTPLVRTVAALEGGDIDETVARWGAMHPLGRIGTPEDIANVIIFLATDKASFMTGEHVCVDGGFMALGGWSSAAGAAAAKE